MSLRPPRSWSGAVGAGIIALLIAAAPASTCLAGETLGRGTPGRGDPPGPALPAAVKTDDGEPDDPLPEWWAEPIEALRSGSIAERGEAAEALLADPDPRQLPFLVDALGHSDRSLRVRITNGVLGAFPDRAADLFLSLLDDEDLDRREAAVFALSALDDPRVVPRLVRLLDDGPEELESGSAAQVMDEAAARSLLNRGRQAANAAFSRATGRSTRQAELLLGVYERTAEVLLEELLDGGRKTEFRRLLFRRYADAAAISAARRALRDANPEDPVGEKIVELGERLAPWCPRPEFPTPGTLRYTIHIQNLFVGSEKSVSIQVSDRDLGPLLYWSYALDRAVRCELPLDLLLLDPTACAPRWVDSEEGGRILYRLPPRTILEVGIGILNIAYWSGTVSDGETVELELDPASGLPSRETVRGADGAPRMIVTYREFVPVREGGFAPLGVNVDILRARIGAREIPMRYQFRFVVEDGLWRFDAGETIGLGSPGGELDEDEVTLPLGQEEVRAIASLSDVRWLPEPPAAGDDDAPEGPGQSSGTGSPAGGD
ncbi:MAG: HEAT repeat domain-containing protein [Planctomycetota bacterium]